MTRTNSWTSRRRRRRRRASQARTLARWTAFCGNILTQRGGPGAPQAGLRTPLTPGPLRSVSQVPSHPVSLGPGSLTAGMPPFPLTWSSHSSCPGLPLSRAPAHGSSLSAAPSPGWTRRLTSPRSTPDTLAAPQAPHSTARPALFSPPLSPYPRRLCVWLPFTPSPLSGNGAILELDGREGPR